MTCDETAEYVSALCDGETIPRMAAEHVGQCEICQTRLKEYMAIGGEMRRMASLELPEEARPRVWDKRRPISTTWWQKGWQSMSIPRVAFASLLVAIVGLASSLTIVGVRAHTQGTVVMLNIAAVSGSSTPCPLSTQDKKWAVCGFVGKVASGILTYDVKLLAKDGERVELGVRTKLDSATSGTYSLSALDGQPEKTYWFEPGETLRVEVPGLGTMAVTGEWMDHMPSVVAIENHDLDPGPEQLRIASPLLLRNKEVLGDLEGAIASIDKPGQGIQIYMPGQGRYELSLSPLQGAVQGNIKLNRLSFQINGQPYTFLTGTPIARNSEVWVLHDPNYQPSGVSGENAFIGMVDLSDLATQGLRQH